MLHKGLGGQPASLPLTHMPGELVQGVSGQKRGRLHLHWIFLDWSLGPGAVEG